jgi:hypothetical protein
LVIANLNFGQVREVEGDWRIDLEEGMLGSERGIWTRERMYLFWMKLVELMKAYGVTNNYPRQPRSRLIRHYDYKRVKLTSESSVGLLLTGQIRKLKGKWSERGCLDFRQKVSELMRQEGLVSFFVQPTVWILVPDSKEGEDA